MQILSILGPDRSISDEDLKRFDLVSKRYRNRQIGNFLKELQLAVDRNTGIPAIVKAMRNNGSEPPRFETDCERTYFSVIRLVHPAFRNQGTVVPSPAAKPVKATQSTSNEIRAMVIH